MLTPSKFQELFYDALAGPQGWWSTDAINTRISRQESSKRTMRSASESEKMEGLIQVISYLPRVNFALLNELQIPVTDLNGEPSKRFTNALKNLRVVPSERGGARALHMCVVDRAMSMDEEDLAYYSRNVGEEAISHLTGDEPTLSIRAPLDAILRYADSETFRGMKQNLLAQYFLTFLSNNAHFIGDKMGLLQEFLHEISNDSSACELDQVIDVLGACRAENSQKDEQVASMRTEVANMSTQMSRVLQDSQNYRAEIENLNAAKGNLEANIAHTERDLIECATRKEQLEGLLRDSESMLEARTRTDRPRVQRNHFGTE